MRSKINYIFLIALIFILAACSSPEEEPAQPLLGINITNKTTTVESETKDGIDSETEDLISSTLSQVLIQGHKVTKLFSDDLKTQAATEFLDNSDAQSNSVTLSLHEMKTPEETIVIVGDIEQSVTKDDLTTSRSGKIFFDPKGIIIGYDLSDFEQESKPE